MIEIMQNGHCLASVTWDGKQRTVAQLLMELSIALELPCGGHGRCGKCLARISGDVEPADAQEQSHLSAPQLREGLRLACRTVICGGTVQVELSASAAMRIETGAGRAGMVWDNGEGLGVSVDIGTTTVVMQMWDRQTHQLLGVQACANPQNRFGADVISRMEASMGGKDKELQQTVTSCLAELARQLCQTAGREKEEIRTAVFTGNTVMLYLLCGYPVRELAAAPFTMSHSFGRSVPASQLGLLWHPACEVYLPPCIGAYVGADITCGILASGLLQEKKPSLLADIGTNGEIALMKEGRLYCCATAAGPAFEGVGISSGSCALPGAIDRVWTEQGKLYTHVIGEKQAAGLCGSGLLDAAAALLRLGLVEESGYMEEQAVELQGDVFLTAKDIRALQLAKSAVCAGIQTLLDSVDLTASDIGKTWLAGGFGSRLRIQSAVEIGLLPADLPKAEPGGNLALAGAAMLLASRDCRDTAEKIAGEAVIIELAANPVFQERFMADIILGEIQS